MDEAAARRVVLAQAIETADTKHKLIAPQAQEQIDRQALQAVRTSGRHPADAFEPVLAQRAQAILDAVQAGQPAIAALARSQPWQRWILFGLPLLTLLLGAFTDRFSDPHRLDLLSQPLLAIVAWNLVMYTLLLVNACLGSGRRTPAMLAGVRQWADGLRTRRRVGNLRAEITALFTLHWHAAAAALTAQRAKRVLHLAAAGWAAGVALSLLARGLFVQYRVGWESTWLDAGQVHAVLGWLLMPAVALFGFDPLTLQEVAALEVHAGGGHAPDRRWVGLYTGLLLLVVIVPRLLLAAFAWWRERRLAGAVVLDLEQPYFQALAAALLPAQLRLGWLAADAADGEALRRVLLQSPRPDADTVIATGEGDTLSLLHAQADARSGALDLLLEITGGSPANTGAVLLIGAPGASADARHALPLHTFARCWAQQPVLFHALEQALPQRSRPGMARLATAWTARNHERLGQSMSTLALQLLEAASEAQEVRSAPLSVRNLVVPADRLAHEQARRTAMAAVAARLQQAAALTRGRLLELHGVDGEQAGLLEHGLEESFLVQEAVNTPQAGLAGATTGAAMGASVDLLTGGLTLGAAAALGALVGGGAAFVAAAWKNRSSPSGVALVQLSDEMLLALLEGGLLHYLAVIHAARMPRNELLAMPSAWKHEVVHAVQTHRTDLLPHWQTARAAQGGQVAESGSALAALLESICLQVLQRLYPAPSMH